ncbi:hypothetical protein DENSPDRAFT_816722 [Dentipellis sp. KUC8613]|nr:hypothetical protein DENSPDRAFT_816722 [Dentipellis sp. KUC8613]
MTGLAQPCDVGIQRPYKLSIRKSQLQDIVDETLEHLENGEDPSDLKLDTRIGTLRKRSVSWFVKAWHDINEPNLVKKAFERCTARDSFNLSFKSLTSLPALKVLQELPRKNPKLWSEISYNEEDASSEAGDDDSDAETALGDSDSDSDADADDDDSALEPRELMAQILSEPMPSAEIVGAADELDPGDINIPEPEELGRGKRRKKPVERYTL